MTLLELITGAWAIQPEKLLELQAIYGTHLRGEKIDIPAIEARLGRPLAAEQQAYTVEQGGIAILRMSGVLAPKANLFMQVSGGISTQMATKQLESASADPRVRATVLAMDTPGGNVIGVPEMAGAVYDLAAIKPIVVHSDGVLASAGYWIGGAANAVYISGPVTEVGSIGVVVSRSFNPNSTSEEEHIVAGRYKRLSKSKEALSDESRAIVQADVDYVYTLFVDDVAKYRGVTSQQVLDHMADGRVFRGQQAINAGLADGIVTLDALVEQMATNPAQFSTRRKAVFALGKPSPKSAGAQAAGTQPEPVLLENSNPETKGSHMDRATLEQQHPALFAQLKSEFSATATAEAVAAATTTAAAAGAASERQRIADVRAQSLPGHSTLIETLAADGKTTGPEAAAAVLAAERTSRAAAAAAHAADAPAAAAHAAAPPDGKAAVTAQSLAKGAVALFKQTNKGA